MPAPLVLEGVHAGYGGIETLGPVDAALATGVHALLGRNGAGKTTLMRVMAGILTPLAGRVLVGQPYQVLLSGLGILDTPDHAVHSLDWVRETVGELPSASRGPKLASARQEQAIRERLAAEAACREALAAKSRRVRNRFEKLLALTQRYALIRAEQASWFTLAWPVLRQCTQRLGSLMASADLLEQADDIFFVFRAELEAYLAGRRPQDLAARCRSRKATWQRNRRLVPPLTLGKPPLLLAKLFSPGVSQPVDAAGTSALCGTPASPGSAAGPVRILRDLADHHDVQPGDVVVVSAAVPALTPLFDRIAALCVDGGCIAAHTSLVAREYGIPMVTGLGRATSWLSNNTWVFVDGTAGVVSVR